MSGYAQWASWSGTPRTLYGWRKNGVPSGLWGDGGWCRTFASAHRGRNLVPLAPSLYFHNCIPLTRDINILISAMATNTALFTGIQGYRNIRTPIGCPHGRHCCPFFHCLLEAFGICFLALWVRPRCRIRCPKSFHLIQIQDGELKRPWRGVAVPGGMPVDQSATNCTPPSCGPCPYL